MHRRAVRSGTLSNRSKYSSKRVPKQFRSFGALNAGYLASIQELNETDIFSTRASAYSPGITKPSTNGTVKAPASTKVQPTSSKVVSPYLDSNQTASLLAYIDFIRRYGYRLSCTNPLDDLDNSHFFLSPELHNVLPQTMEAPASCLAPFLGKHALVNRETIADLVNRLRNTYCNTTSYEISHIRNRAESDWLATQIEFGLSRRPIENSHKRYLLELITRSETFELFLHKAFPGQRWYSLEGSESVIALTDQIIMEAVSANISNIVFGMAHRGRLNFLAHVLDKPYSAILSEFMEGDFAHLATLDGSQWMTDVKYHLGTRINRDIDSDGTPDITLMLFPNPSHLEVVNPAVIGGVRAIQDTANGREGDARSMAVLFHGDAAFAGQGIVAETLNLSSLSGYDTGGSIHIILNNQIGFTTNPADSFSGEQSSDVARGFDIPIAHVNAEDVEACVSVAQLAVAYRRRFGKDFLINLLAYRRHGHNENDDPSITQPITYKKIKTKPSVRALFATQLDKEGVVSAKEAEVMVETCTRELFSIKTKLESDRPVKQQNRSLSPHLTRSLRRGSRNGSYEEKLDSANILIEVSRCITEPPEGFSPHPSVARMMRARSADFASGKADWAFAEALAIGSILKGGTSIRFTGQDVERGTFSHRHAVMFDSKTGETWTPLASLGPGSFSIYNSPLSEISALGFEHGYSVARSQTLVIWEAQFGDFVNNAQSVVDEMIVSAKAKWGQASGLTLLLPHGYEGQGPNHSHAHLERFLALAAKDNVRVAYPTEASQYFHLLRIQTSSLSVEPKPLVIMTPKSLLRHPLATSKISHLLNGRFMPVIVYNKDGIDAVEVKRIVLCTGKVYMDLALSTAAEKARDFAVVRIEELYPFPEEELGELLASMRNAERVIWLQEEPENRGAWLYVRSLLERILGDRSLEYVGRPPTPSPAEGANWLHRIHQNQLIHTALGVGL